MPFLTVLGVTVPVADGSMGRQPERVGDVDADGPGRPAMIQRGMRRRWEFTTPPIRQALADRIADLVEGV